MSSSLSITLGELSEKIGAILKGDADTIVTGLGSLKNAQKDQVSFLSRVKYLPDLKNTNAAAVILSEDHSEGFIGNKLIGNNPYLLYAKASKVFKELVRPSEEPGISKNTEISNSSLVHDSATIGPFTTISANSKISKNVSIGSGSFIGKNVSIGSGTIIYPNVSIYDSVEIGSDCIIHSGTVIGSDGLGFAKEDNKWFKIEHLGKVIIHDEVEIGSNSSIDRGSVGDTLISKNVKIDNLVHLAHNVEIGEGTAIAARSAIAGSSKIGRNCTLAGCVAIVDNVKITDEVHITAMTLITKSISKSGIYSSGTPFMENSDWKKSAIRFKQLKN